MSIKHLIEGPNGLLMKLLWFWSLFYPIPLLGPVIRILVAITIFPFIGRIRFRVLSEFCKQGSVGAEIGVWKGEFSR
jgi:hypothetical protein